MYVEFSAGISFLRSRNLQKVTFVFFKTNQYFPKVVVVLFQNQAVGSIWWQNLKFEVRIAH